MGTAGRSAPLRRTGSLLGLLGLEVAAVLALHWLGRLAGLRIRWEEPVTWLVSSPVQEVLGAVLRTVGLVMAYWLLASTLVYLLASLTRLPAAVRAVSWATLPLVRRVADHALAVTLATSMVGGGTLGMAGPAAATDSGGSGPPARKQVAAAQATSAAQEATSTSAGEATGPSPPSYVPNPAEQVPTSGAGESTTTTAPEATTTTTRETTTSTEATTTTVAPTTTTQEPTTTAGATSTTAGATTTAGPTSTTAGETSTTAGETSTTAGATSTTAGATTTTAGETTTTGGAGGRPAPPAYVPEPAGQAPTRLPVSGPTSTDPTTGPTAAPSTAAATTSTTGLRPPAYEFTPATTTPAGPGARESAGDPGGGNSDSGNSGGGNSDGDEQPEPEDEQAYRVERGDNLWAIARDHLSRVRGGGSGEPTNREVADYWLRVVEANREGLRSGDPDLIYPGERIVLPPVD